MFEKSAFTKKKSSRKLVDNNFARCDNLRFAKHGNTKTRFCAEKSGDNLKFAKNLMIDLMNFGKRLKQKIEVNFFLIEVVSG